MASMLHQSIIAENTFQVTIGLKDIVIDNREIAYTLGYTDGLLPHHFEEMIDEVLKRTSELCKPQAGYRMLDVVKAEGIRDSLVVDGVQFHTDQIVTAQIRKADRVIFFLCSIGPGMETWSRHFAHEGDPTMSYFVDTVASLIVEAAVDTMHNYIAEQLKLQGLKITNRYSPGYCDWSVEEQKKLFSFFPKEFCGVTLTDSALMIPIKSVSGLIGVGKDVAYQQYFCDTCGRKDCTYKAFREKQSKTSSKGN
jgi:hypothetical protein